MDEFVVDILTHNLHNETPNLDHFFTPERLAEIDALLADVRAGNMLTSDQAEEKLAKSREARLHAHPNAK